MTTKHTPGPWTVNGQQVRDGDRVAVATVHGIMPEARANARLIAAAPAMLGALQDLVEDFGGLSGGSESLDVARAILKHLGVEA